VRRPALVSASAGGRRDQLIQTKSRDFCDFGQCGCWFPIRRMLQAKGQSSSDRRSIALVANRNDERKAKAGEIIILLSRTP
jgi:hypothetical protein